MPGENGGGLPGRGNRFGKGLEQLPGLSCKGDLSWWKRGSRRDEAGADQTGLAGRVKLDFGVRTVGSRCRD